jgi:Clostripain family
MPGKDHKRWTVLIYMVADDPQGGELLDRQAVQEMDQITKATLSVEHPEHLHVAVQVDFRTLPGVWRRVIGQSTFVRPESNAADPATLYGFFDWAAAECPADHYLLIFWGHSRGQFGMFGDSDPFDYTAQTLTLEELRAALEAAKRSLQKPMDVIAFKDCFMANLETAYELSGLADYLLASPGLVPVEGWPYDAMFEALTDRANGARKPNERALDAGKRILEALKAHYEIEANRKRHDEVPYSLLSTKSAVPVVTALGNVLGKDRPSVDLAEGRLRSALEAAAADVGDPALADLGRLVSNAAAERARTAQQKPQPDALKEKLEAFVNALGDAQPKNSPTQQRAGRKRPRQAQSSTNSEGLVINHTGQDFGGVSVFVFPSDTKDQRDSMLTRLADEKAYRRLAISKDTKWADIALGKMPIQQARPVQDVSKAIALIEQLERMGVGTDPRSAARAGVYLRRRARFSRNADPTEADLAEAAQYAAIANLAVRLADFAATKGGADFVKSGDDFVKSGDDFVKSGDDFVKSGDDFGPR